MADPSPRAFGAYLRQLRERRQLTINQVSLLTKNASERLDRGALSRFENGRQVPSLFKLGPLCRVYEVSADVLNERMELDREVDRSAAPDTSTLSYEELREAGRAFSLEQDKKYEAFACFRDALTRASAEERPQAWLNLATIIRSLGKNRLARQELFELLRSGLLNRAREAVALDRIANCHRCLREFDEAVTYADRAINVASEVGDRRALAFAYSSRANIETDRRRYGDAEEYLKLAFRAYRASRRTDSLLASNPPFEVNTLLMIAECQIELGHPAKARRNALTAAGIADRSQLAHAHVGCEVILGRIDEKSGASEKALRRWERAIDLARSNGNRKGEFTAEFYRFRHLHAAGREKMAAAARKRLERLVPGIPQHLTLLSEFRAIIGPPKTLGLGHHG